MSLNAKKVPMAAGKGDRVEQAPMDPGTYPARVVQVLDMGVQPQRPYKGQDKPPAHMISLTYEFLDEFCLDEEGEEIEDKPRWLSEDFPLKNLEIDLATSTKRYKALDPDEVFDGDFTALVNATCMVTVVQNPDKNGKKDANGKTKVYTNVSGVSAMRPKEAKNAAELVNEPKVFVLDEPDMTIFKSLPEWIQDKIKGNLEFEGSALQEALEGAQEDEEEAPKPKAKGKPKKAAKEPEEDDDEDDEKDW